jgi:enoyl-CoA hydratase
MSEFIKYDVDGRIATITIDRPEKRNAMTWAMLSAFDEAVARASADDDTQVVIITGSGGAFCAGTDLSDLGSGLDRTPRSAEDVRDPWWPIGRCPKPVVAAVDGAAVGMGAEFTSQCDVRIASTRARFAWNFVHRGLVPDTGAGTWLLPRLIGVQQALRLLYSGEFLGAAEALEIGYVSAIVEPDDLADAARAEATRYLAGSPFSQRLIKDLVYRGLGRDLSEHIASHVPALQACFASEDHKEGVASFLERREPHFTGR